MQLTTARSGTPKPFLKNPLLLSLAAICAAVWVWAAIGVEDRNTWMLENLLVLVGLVLIVRMKQLSDLSNLLLAVFFVLHTVGAHYTYSHVPFGQWMQEAFDLERNHYDRVVHFSWGLLLTYPIREIVMRKSGLRAFGSLFFTATIIATCSEVYELIEWGAMQIVDPKAGLEFLGTQGDAFDAQKDTGLALIGAIITLSAIALLEKKRGRA